MGQLIDGPARQTAVDAAMMRVRIARENLNMVAVRRDPLLDSLLPASRAQAEHRARAALLKADSELSILLDPR